MDTASIKKDWKIFSGKLEPHDGINSLPDPPPWRKFTGKVEKERQMSDEQLSVAFSATDRGRSFRLSDDPKDKTIELVNAALYLRRPLLITGKPGTGKSSLIYAVAWELKLGNVLRWPITSRSTLKQGLYDYDAIGRLQEYQFNSREEQKGIPNISEYITLGPLGTALLPTNRPRALLIDEIDKSDLDLPNDLLNIFEEGEFEIPELRRIYKHYEKDVDLREHGGDETFPISRGHIRCREFPFIVLTSNGEREFPAPFLRRCLQLTMGEPSEDLLAKIVRAHLGDEIADSSTQLIRNFIERRNPATLATDQLLNALFMVNGNASKDGMVEDERKKLIQILLQSLTNTTI
jgi:MoxR-like ATPase